MRVGLDSLENQPALQSWPSSGRPTIRASHCQSQSARRRRSRTDAVALGVSTAAWVTIVTWSSRGAKGPQQRPPSDQVEHRRRAFQRGVQSPRSSGVARVLGRWARPTSQPARRVPRPGRAFNAVGVGEDDLVGPARRSARSDRSPDRPRPSNGQPKATLIVAVERRPSSRARARTC